MADFFDCTPLKLTAWRVIQENKPGYSTAPAEILQALATGPKGTNQETVKGPPKRFIGHGLIGPGERIYGANYEDQQSSGRYPPANMQDESDDEEEGTVSIFNTTISGDPAGEGLLSSGQKRYDYYVRPDQLPKGTPAKEVVRAWAFRLQQVYQECCEEQGISPDQMNQLQRNQRSPQQSQSSPVLQSAPQSTSLTRNSVSLQQVQRRQNPPAVNRMPSLDRISDISDPPQQEQISQRSTPQRQTSRPTLTPQLSTGTVGSQSRTGGIAVSRGSVAAQGRGMYPDTIEEKETDTVSTEEKDESYTAPISKQPFQTPTLATRPSIRPTPTALPPPSAPPNTVATTLTIDWKEELRKFYISRGLMDKLDSLDTILNAWEGKEKEMIEALYGKYQMKIPSELQQKLIKWEELYGGGDSETQSER